MTLRCRDLSEMPADIAAVGRQVLPPTNPYRVIGDHLADLLDDAQFADLYDTRGRNALSPALLAMVTLFQFLEDIPDREATTQVVVRLDWKYALHLPLLYSGFDHTCLCHFRQRLLAHQQDTLVFETILGKVRALGFVKKRGKQRTDSIAVLGAARQLSALETVTETLRLAVRALAQVDASWLEQAMPAGVRARYADLRPDYRLSAQEQAALFAPVGRDGYGLLGRLDTAAVTVRELEAVTVMRMVWAQRYRRDAGDAGVVTVRTEPVPCTERIVTPHDPGVRAGEKRGKTWRGENVHVTETAEAATAEATDAEVAGVPTFITDVTTANASGGDADLHLSEHYELLAARRAAARTEAFRARMRARPAIEATLSELVRQHGLRHHRSRGEAKHPFENLLKAAACNLKRLVRAVVARWRQDSAGGQAVERAASPSRQPIPLDAVRRPAAVAA